MSILTKYMWLETKKEVEGKGEEHALDCTTWHKKIVLSSYTKVLLNNGKANTRKSFIMLKCNTT